MNPKPHLKDFARTLYFQTEHTQAQIAELVGVHRRTVHLWIKYGDWKKMKAAASQSPQVFVQDVYNQLEELNAHIRSREPGNRFPTRDEADIIRKLTMSLKAINVRPLSDTVLAFEELTGEIYKDDRDLGRLVVQYADRIIKKKKKGLHFYFPDDEEETPAAEPRPVVIPPAPETTAAHTEVTTDDKESNNDVTTEVTKSNNDVTSPAAPQTPPNPPPTKITWDNRFPRYRSWKKNNRNSNNSS